MLASSLFFQSPAIKGRSERPDPEQRLKSYLYTLAYMHHFVKGIFLQNQHFQCCFSPFHPCSAVPGMEKSGFKISFQMLSFQQGGIYPSYDCPAGYPLQNRRSKPPVSAIYKCLSIHGASKQPSHIQNAQEAPAPCAASFII